MKAIGTTVGGLITPPRLRTSNEVDGKRSATWLELFFDLVFVIAVAQLAVAFGDDLSAAGFVRFLLLFVPVWWGWLGFTMYADRFDTDDIVFRLLVLAGMLAVAALAVGIPRTFSGDSTGFAVAYAFARLTLITLYARAYRHVPVARALCAVTGGVFSLGTGLWLVSLLAPEPVRFGFWAVALGIEGATPWIARRAMASIPVHASHLPERFGLFTLIVLGESLVAVVVGIGAARWDARSGAVGVLGFVVAASLWWIYFDFAEASNIKRGLLARNAFIYWHLPTALGLTGVGVGIKKAILYADRDILPVAAGWSLGGGTALFLLAAAGICATSATPRLNSVVLARSVASAVVLAFVAIPVWRSSFGLTSLLVACLLALVVVEAVVLSPAAAADRGAATLHRIASAAGTEPANDGEFGSRRFLVRTSPPPPLKPGRSER